MIPAVPAAARPLRRRSELAGNPESSATSKRVPTLEQRGDPFTSFSNAQQHTCALQGLLEARGEGACEAAKEKGHRLAARMMPPTQPTSSCIQRPSPSPSTRPAGSLFLPHKPNVGGPASPLHPPPLVDQKQYSCRTEPRRCVPLKGTQHPWWRQPDSQKSRSARAGTQLKDSPGTVSWKYMQMGVGDGLMEQKIPLEL